MRNIKIDYENLGDANRPFFEEYKKVFAETLEGGWFILGKNVERFEKTFALYCGGGSCIGVASGLDALILSLPLSYSHIDDDILTVIEVMNKF